MTNVQNAMNQSNTRRKACYSAKRGKLVMTGFQFAVALLNISVNDLRFKYILRTTNKNNTDLYNFFDTNVKNHKYMSLLIIYVFINSVSTLSIVLFLTRLIILLSCLGFNGEGIFCALSTRAIQDSYLNPDNMKQVNHKMLPSVQICSDSFHKRLAHKLRCESRARKEKTLYKTKSQN